MIRTLLLALVAAVALGTVPSTVLAETQAQEAQPPAPPKPGKAPPKPGEAPPKPGKGAPPGHGHIEVLEDRSPAPREYKEPPMLAEKVAAGELPPVAERLPRKPAVFVAGEGKAKKLGRSGGDLTTLVTRDRDTRLIAVYGYARLVGYNEAFDLEVDLLEKIEIEDSRIFTLHLREGHRWSDGHPFTTEDFRYWWEDVANNSDLSPAGPDIVMLVDGEPPRVEVLDERRIRYSWKKPNPHFLPALAGTLPTYIFRPAHYMKQLHEKYADAEALAHLVEENGTQSWAQLHNRKDNLYRGDNPDLPTLEPWKVITWPPSIRFVAVRNPYFHRVDADGMQLPYLDRFVLNVAGGGLVPAKTGSGDSDIQARGIAFSDYTFLKRGEKEHDYHVRLWETVRGSAYALYPNLNVNDPAWRKLNRDVRFRRALSMAVDREEINQLIYFGLGQGGPNLILDQSPLYEPDLETQWSDYDPDAADRLLDEIGLDKRNASGIRLLPDGRPVNIIIETAGESPEETDVLQLITETWRKVGIDVFTRPSQRELLRNRIFAGDTIMTLWFGNENGIPGADTDPAEFVPVRQHSYQWPKWGQYHETKGLSGEPVDMPEAEELLKLYDNWLNAPSREARRAAWERILKINAEQVYTIGTVSKVPQPVVVVDALKNVPEKAIFNWEPGAQFGVYRTDSWFLE